MGERGGKFGSIAKESGLFDETHFLLSGKFRRYHNQPLTKSLLDIKTNFLNIRDLVKICLGIVQGIFLLRRLKADSILLKGGSVCIPAGIGARLAGVMTITHDSDALPGVSNRIGGKHAKYHATAMPAEYYKYPKGKIIHVGLPVSELFREYSGSEIAKIKQKMNIPTNSTVLMITGGSNGAKRLNDWCAEGLPKMLNHNDRLYVIFVTGKGKLITPNLDNSAKERLKIVDFTDEMHNLSAISDVIISRAGATTIAEFAAQSKPLILVPNPDLTGGHQIKNSKVYTEQEAAIVLEEKQISEDPDIIPATVSNLLNNKQMQIKLGRNLHSTVLDTSAARRIAQLLLEGRG